MFAGADTIEGGQADFLDETVGNLQLQIMDQSVANQRQQAGYANQAFRQDFAADQARSAGPINAASAALSGFNSVFTTGAQVGKWGQPKKNPAAKAPPSAIV
jgi:molybdopterin-guanine dinucleotide biosynthesis protein A